MEPDVSDIVWSIIGHSVCFYFFFFLCHTGTCPYFSCGILSSPHLPERKSFVEIGTHWKRLSSYTFLNVLMEEVKFYLTARYIKTVRAGLPGILGDIVFAPRWHHREEDLRSPTGKLPSNLEGSDQCHYSMCVCKCMYVCMHAHSEKQKRSLLMSLIALGHDREKYLGAFHHIPLTNWPITVKRWVSDCQHKWMITAKHERWNDEKENGRQ